MKAHFNKCERKAFIKTNLYSRGLVDHELRQEILKTTRVCPSKFATGLIIKIAIAQKVYK